MKSKTTEVCVPDPQTLWQRICHVSHSDSSSGTYRERSHFPASLAVKLGSHDLFWPMKYEQKDERHHFRFEAVKSQCAFSISLLQGDLGAHWSRIVIHKLQCAYESPGSLTKCRSCCGGTGGEDLKFFISKKQLNG